MAKWPCSHIKMDLLSQDHQNAQAFLMHLQQTLNMNHDFQCFQIVELSDWSLCKTDLKICQLQDCSVVRSCWLFEMKYLTCQDRYLQMLNEIWSLSRLQMMMWSEFCLTLQYIEEYAIAFVNYSYSLLHPSECALKTSNIRTLTAVFLVRNLHLNHQ